MLREAEIVVAEDTRVARKLLAALGIEGRPIWSYREQNAESVTAGNPRAREDRRRRRDRAMPACPASRIPEVELVAAARREGIAVEVLPGPSAATGVALLSGFPLRRFRVEGFPPRASGQRRERFATALRGGRRRSGTSRRSASWRR